MLCGLMVPSEMRLNLSGVVAWHAYIYEWFLLTGKVRCVLSVLGVGFEHSLA